MTAIILDGKRVALQQKLALKAQISRDVAEGKRPPALAVILVGNDPASFLYVNNKRKACVDTGIQSFAHYLSDSVTQSELLSLIDVLNHDALVDGILVQLPLPKHIDPYVVIDAISPTKDVDGFHPYNFGRLAQGNPSLRPCTPYGVVQLLDAYQLSVKGLQATVIGASNIVGRPMALELLLAGATVSICHRLTQDLRAYVVDADIVVSATGVRDVIQTEWLHANQIVIDIGMHRLDDQRLCGDIDFEKAKNRVGWITPVPGGVGPMTVSTLLKNTHQVWLSRT